jgi:hypothetical protein
MGIHIQSFKKEEATSQTETVALHRGYWGYSEMTPEELKAVTGAGDGCGGGCGGCGGAAGDAGADADADAVTSDATASAAAASQADSDPETNGTVGDLAFSDPTAGQQQAGLGCNIVGGLVGVGIAAVTGPTVLGAVAGVIGGSIATEACERITNKA